MTKEKLGKAVADSKAVTREALQTVFDETKKGSRKQLLKNEKVKALFDRYGVDYGGDIK